MRHRFPDQSWQPFDGSFQASTRREYGFVEKPVVDVLGFFEGDHFGTPGGLRGFFIQAGGVGVRTTSSGSFGFALVFRMRFRGLKIPKMPYCMVRSYTGVSDSKKPPYSLMGTSV